MGGQAFQVLLIRFDKAEVFYTMETNDKDMIMGVIEEYMKSIKTGKDEHFAAAFRDDAVVINASEKEDESKVVTPIADFIARVKKRHEDGIPVEEIPEKITIGIAKDVANARVDFKLIVGDKTIYGTDFFNLIKRDNQWKISQKIYDVQRTE
jgi:hypothetical protein